MKYSYTLLKKLVPQIKNKKELEEKLTMFAFEVDAVEGNTFDIKLYANRYSDAGSHFGMAREICAIYGIKNSNRSKINTALRAKVSSKGKPNFSIKVEDKNLCPRYIGKYFENIQIKESPKWMKDILIECGMRPINNVVDVMNYVMIETGQPLHAFDFDKLEGDTGGGNIIVRRAKNGEKFITLDDNEFVLSDSDLVIADTKGALAIAGIKGGKRAEVDKNTKRIIVEAANFDATNIYKTSRRIKLATDASRQFSRNISPELAALAISRVDALLKELSGAKEGMVLDVYRKKPAKKIIGFRTGKFEKLIGVSLSTKEIKKYLELLGFKVIPSKNNLSDFLVEIPVLRLDIEDHNDLAEEITRLYGIGNLKPVPPKVSLVSSGFEDQIILKEKIAKIMTGFGFNEARNYSFIADTDEVVSKYGNRLVEVENPISREFQFMRPSLSAGFVKNIDSNARFFDQVDIFEFGRIFEKEGSGIKEKEFFGIAKAAKNAKAFFEIKGLVANLFKSIGITDCGFSEADDLENKYPAFAYLKKGEALKITAGGKEVGFVASAKNKFVPDKWTGVIAEIDLKSLVEIAESEFEYRELPKYPSIMRDISILVESSVKIGNVIKAMQEVDLKYIEDIDLIDEYALVADQCGHDADKRGQKDADIGRQNWSLTFRIVFQADDRTMTGVEVNEKMQAIEKILKEKFGAEIR